MKLIEIIKVASSAYPDDLIMRYHKNSRHDFGDTLAQFAAREIKSTYEPREPDDVQLDCARRAINTAAQQLADVAAALQRAMPNPGLTKPAAPATVDAVDNKAGLDPAAKA